MTTLRVGIAAALVGATVLLSGAAAVTPDDVPLAQQQEEQVEQEPEIDPIRNMEYWLDEYGVTDAWKVTQGEGTTIAVIDTGIGKGAEELNDAVVGGADFSGIGTPDGRTPVGDGDSNHGSWVGSLAAGRGTGAGKGMVGVAPKADLLSLSIGFGESATVPFIDQVAEAMVWAVDHGADVINLSFTTNTLDWDRSWDDAFLYAFEHDVVVVVAAGNRETGTEEVGAPATIPGVLTVGGVDRERKASNTASTQGISIGISAPSEELLGLSANGDLVIWEGTSGAAPLVSGIAALVRSAHPDLDAANVINRIIKTADPAGDREGRDPLYGYGLVNAAAAVAASVPVVSENPMGDLAEWIRLYRRADAEPTPRPTVTPVEIPPLPEAEPPTQAGSALLPSADSLRYGTVPLVALSLGTILVVLGVTAAARRIKSARLSRSPSRPIKE
ncbi:S8 family peptidase [Microbacterium dauci]|uniref:S8 family serine peptidase n=1 Tax=Microbacterium dauci TaxID=3048008 RepID=A0ABT6ZCF1_9MICO|nr:S8 family serine peptidase [Microbacterium sp. LX3-4]MDJ1113385.1 S8 family serine peptidase [Microbacterium sp. LX3-4]